MENRREDYIAHLNRLAIEDSDEFYAYERPDDFDLLDGIVRFHSPVSLPYPENNLVHAQWFPAANSKKAVVLLPHWNAPVDGHNALCRGLARLGISALRISLPYHDYRMPAELKARRLCGFVQHMPNHGCGPAGCDRRALLPEDWQQMQAY